MGITAERRHQLEGYVVSTEFKQMGMKTTVCVLTLVNSHEIVGTSACVKVSDFDPRLGEVFAYEDAMEALDPKIGFLEQDKDHRVRHSLDTKRAQESLADRMKKERDGA